MLKTWMSSLESLYVNHRLLLRKYYGDFSKSAIAIKVHLNDALKPMVYILSTKIKTVISPMLLVMGLSCVIYGMNIIDKKVYALQKTFLTTLAHCVKPRVARSRQ